ncbi:MAG: MFS transporter [Chloroflexi bacterium]|nr:MFS transporter [Chloroflexota bacterium]
MTAENRTTDVEGTGQPVGPPRSGEKGYVESIKSFSRNAKLFLAYSLLSGLGTGIWNVMLNLYFLRVGVDIPFIGVFWFTNMLFHGLFAFPAGLIGDKIGRRKTFILATFISIFARGALLFTLDPTMLIVLAAIAGAGEGFHAVAGAPFIMENSKPAERPMLFSLDSSFGSASMFVGSISGGLLPLVWASTMGIPDLDPVAARFALVTSLPLTVIALLPLALIKERPVALVESFLDLVTLANIVSHSVIAKLTLCSVLIGVAFGLTTRFFNVFFADGLGASDQEVGLIFALSSLGSAALILASPAMSRRWGRVLGILVSQVGSLPFLILMVLLPGLPLAATFFILRGALYGISMPLRHQLSMEFITSRERATTAGITHMVFDLGGAVGAWAAGILIVENNFAPAFLAGALIFLAPAILYYVFFAGMEKARAARRVTRPAV